MLVLADRHGRPPVSIASGHASPTTPPSYLAAQPPSATPSKGREHARLHPLSVKVRDYVATDADGFIGVVDEVRADGTISIACGWFGRREVLVDLGDVECVNDADRELVLRAGLSAIAELRATSGAARRLAARLLGRALTRS